MEQPLSYVDQTHFDLVCKIKENIVCLEVNT